MAILVNPQLGNMTSDDLGQRYAETHVIYRGNPVYVYGFMGDRGDVAIEYGAINTNMERDEELKHKVEAFVWQEFDVARPASGWYIYNDPREKREIPFLLSYPIKRQWKRGISNRNTQCYYPFFEASRYGCAAKTALLGREEHRHLNKEMLSAQRSFILRGNLLLAAGLQNGDDIPRLYFRNRLVASFKPEGICAIHDKRYEQEVRELFDATLRHSLTMTAETPQTIKQPQAKPAGRGVGLGLLQRDLPSLVFTSRNEMRQELLCLVDEVLAKEQDTVAWAGDDGRHQALQYYCEVSVQSDEIIPGSALNEVHMQLFRVFGRKGYLAELTGHGLPDGGAFNKQWEVLRDLVLLNGEGCPVRLGFITGRDAFRERGNLQSCYLTVEPL